MLRLSCILVLIGISAFGAPPSASAADDAGFVPLFDGKTLAGWTVHAEKPVAEDQWSFKDGILTAKPGISWLGTNKEYGNFVLRLEWRLPTNGNSGVFVHVPPLKPGEQPHVKGIEVQVLDDQGSEYVDKIKPWQFSGSIYGVVPAANADYHGPGEWNRYEITCRGDKLTVVYNGRQVAEANVADESELKDRPRKGAIGLQNHGTAVEFRNVEVKVLD
jgi:hypothetical protein